MPLISIIIPVYNVQKYLKRCFDSVVNQTFKNFEVIVVDDGSTDSSLEICNKYAKSDSRFKIFHKSNGGLSDARNYGLRYAKGKFISFVDSDDWLQNDALEYLYELLVKTNADFSMAENRRCKRKSIYTNQINISEEIWDKSIFLKNLFKISTQINVQYAWAKLFKRELFENIRFPVGLTNEDVPTIFEIALSSDKIAYSNKIVYNYFFNENSITTQKFSEKRLDLLKIWDTIIEISQDKKCSSWVKKYALLNRYRANFGILTNLATSHLSLSEKKIFIERHDYILKDLRKEYIKLMKAKIPKSRKVLITLYCLNYNFSLTFIHLLVTSLRRRG